MRVTSGRVSARRSGHASVPVTQFYRLTDDARMAFGQPPLHVCWVLRVCSSGIGGHLGLLMALFCYKPWEQFCSRCYEPVQ